MGLGSCRLRLFAMGLWMVDSGGVGSFAEDVAGLGADTECGFEGDRRGASGAGPDKRREISMFVGGERSLVMRLCLVVPT